MLYLKNVTEILRSEILPVGILLLYQASHREQFPGGLTAKVLKREVINCKTPPYCKAATSLGPNVYDFATRTYTWTIPEEYKIIVPLGTKDVYQTTWPWSRYDERCYIQRNTSGIETVEVDGSQDEESIFSLDGRQIDFKQKGVNIVRHKDGTAKKVLVR